MLLFYLFSTAIFMLTALLNLLTASLHPSHTLAAQYFLLLLILILSNERVNQYLHSFIPYTGKLWNFLPLSVFPPAYDLNSFKRGVSNVKLELHSLLLFLLLPSLQVLTTSGIFFIVFLFTLRQCPFNVQKNK